MPLPPGMPTLKTDSLTAVPKLSRDAASSLYSGGTPLSHREEAAATRERPSQRAGNTEVAAFSQLLTNRHATAADKMKAATEVCTSGRSPLRTHRY